MRDAGHGDVDRLRRRARASVFVSITLVIVFLSSRWIHVAVRTPEFGRAGHYRFALSHGEVMAQYHFSQVPPRMTWGWEFAQNRRAGLNLFPIPLPVQHPTVVPPMRTWRSGGVPLAGFVILSASLSVMRVNHYIRARSRRLLVCCSCCGYSLLGGATDRCPECGKAITP